MASVGAIAFVGLIIPHGVRFLVGPLHRVLLPFSALTGAIFLVWTDALARVAFAPREVPVGVFTALVGVPLFLLVLRMAETDQTVIVALHDLTLAARFCNQLVLM